MAKKRNLYAVKIIDKDGTLISYWAFPSFLVASRKYDTIVPYPNQVVVIADKNGAIRESKGPGLSIAARNQ